MDRERIAQLDVGDVPSEVAHIVHGLITNSRDHVAGLQTRLGRDRIIADRRDQHTLVDTEMPRKLWAELDDLDAQSPPPGEHVEIKAKPEVGSTRQHLSKIATGTPERLFNRREPGRSALRHDLDLQPIVITNDRGRHRTAGGRFLDQARQLQGAPHALVVELDDDISRLESSPACGALLTNRSDHGTLGQGFGLALFDVMNRDPDVAASNVGRCVQWVDAT